MAALERVATHTRLPNLSSHPIRELHWSREETRRMAAAQEAEARRWIDLAQQAERDCPGVSDVGSSNASG